MDYQFCGVFVVKKRLFVCREEGVGGPRVMVLPPQELDPAVDDATLGAAIEAALQAYRDAGRRMTPSEWEVVNQRLLGLFGETSIATFERKKRDVTVRLESATGRVQLFGPKGREVSLERPGAAELGRAARGLLGLAPAG